jgi:hypothetical protein
MKKLLALIFVLSLLAAPAMAATPSQTLSGTFSQSGLNYFIEATQVHFGPTWYLASTKAFADYDKDGTVETIAQELSGLVGTTVTLTGCTGAGVFNVFTINGSFYRDPATPPPWTVR